MDANYAACETRLLVHEGGYANDPRDPGGPTNWGVTLADARLYWKPNATAEDVRCMPKSVAMAIYRQKYWLRMACDKLPAGVDDAVFDYGVNSGIVRAGKVLRRVLRMADDTGAITASVVGAAQLKDPDSLLDAICDERMAFLQRLPTFDHFGNGWTKRVAEVRAYGHVLAFNARGESGALPAPTPIPGKQGKGSVPRRKGPGKVIKTAPPAAGAAGWAAFHDWVAAHPLEVAGIATGTLALAGAGLWYLEHRHRTAQEAAPPGWTPPAVLPLAPKPLAA